MRPARNAPGIAESSNRRDLFSRSFSDSHAVQQSATNTPLTGNTSVDDLELAMQKPSTAMSYSNSLPNLADLNAEPLPDITDWGDLDLPFDIFATESFEHQYLPSETNVAVAPARATMRQDSSKRKIEVGIADKTHFFRHESANGRPSGMPPLPTHSPDRGTSGSGFFRTDGANHGDSSSMQQASSSSASADTRDTMRELAKQIVPVNRDGVEFAPLDMILSDEIQLNVSGSYSMSVDEALLQDASLNMSMDKKYDPPGSFSMSSWSQHTISADVFGPHSVGPKAEFSRDGLLLSRRAPSDQSITEKMLDEEWNPENFDVDGNASGPAGNARGPPRLTQQALQQHQQASAGGNRSVRAAAAAGTSRSNRPAMARTSKLNSSGRNQNDANETSQSLNIAIDRTAAVPVEPSPPPPQPQYTFPSTYSSLARSNSGLTSGTASTSSSVDASQSPALTPVYDPSTGIVYYPHVPPGAMPTGNLGTLPAHLLPLPINAANRSPSFPDRMLPVPHISDDGTPPDMRYEEGHYAQQRSSSNSSKFEVGTSGGSAPGSNTTTPKTTTKKEKNRGSYRCGRCGKPKVNHVCAFVDATAAVSQAVQASGPILNPANMQPFPGDRVLTVNPARKSIQPADSRYEKLGMVGEYSRSGSMRVVSRSNSGFTQDSAVARSASSATGSEITMPPMLAHSNSGSTAIFDSLSRSGDDFSFAGPPEQRSPGGSGSNRPSVAFQQPLVQIPEQKEAAQAELNAELDDVFFPTAFPPSAGLVFNGSRNSSVNSTYGNESDTSSTYGDTHQRSSLSNMLNVDLGLSKFFRF